MFVQDLLLCSVLLAIVIYFYRFLFSFALLLLCAQAKAEPPKNTEDLSASERECSLATGIISHNTHLVDLILAQAGVVEGRRHIDAFRTLVLELLDQAEAGLIPQVNEKIDGAPSIVLGFDAKLRPFVTYKGQIKHISEKGSKRLKNSQILVRSVTESNREFRLKPVHAGIYKSLIKHLSPRMRRQVMARFEHFLIQGDLLFAEHGGRIQREGDCILLKPNTVEYKLCAEHPLYESLSRAKVGLVLHTIAKRVVGKDGRIYDSVEREQSEIDKFVELIRSQNVFVATPWRSNVAIAKENPLSQATARLVLSLLQAIDERMNSLSGEFRRSWGKNHESRFATFFNSSLYNAGQGGIYAGASQSKPFHLDTILEELRAWLTMRSLQEGEKSLTPAYLKILENDLAAYGQDFATLIESYYDAIRIQYLLKPAFSEAFQSVLGGVEGEGLMLKTGETIVKLVDRLVFTRRNFAAKNWGALSDFSLYPEPLNQWHPDAIFVVMKGQPFHSGHIAMIRELKRLYPQRKLFVIASEKAPNLDAAHYKALGAADNKTKLGKGEYTHVFNHKIRSEILELGLGEEVPFYFLDTSLFTSYLSLAHSLNLEGTVYRALGAKEEDTPRFADEFRRFSPQIAPLYVEMQEGGISATEVRTALAELAGYQRTKPIEAQAVLDRALSMIGSEHARKHICSELIRQYRALNRVAKKLTEKRPR